VTAQDYGGRVDVVIVDGGSTDETIDIARRFEVERILENELKTGEAGKALGLKAAEGDLLLSLDSDNVVAGSDWLRRMVEPFADPDVWSAQPLRWEYRRQDHFITRWAALTGVGDPLALYVGNYDRYSHLTGRWTDYPHQAEQREGWLRVKVDPRWVPTIGANGYLVRREALEQVALDDYFFDVDFAYDLVQLGLDTIALVDVPIRQYFSHSVSGFYLKTRRRVDNFYFFSSLGLRSYPWMSRKKSGVARFVASTLRHRGDGRRRVRPFGAPPRRRARRGRPDCTPRTPREPSRGLRDSRGRASCGTCAASAVPAGWSPRCRRPTDRPLERRRIDDRRARVPLEPY
jgi:GT2 family glycosyltransferase